MDQMTECNGWGLMTGVVTGAAFGATARASSCAWSAVGECQVVCET